MKGRDEQRPIRLHVKRRYKVADQVENQEVRLEQRVHWMNPALRDPLFIYPPARARTQHTHTHTHSHKVKAKTPNSLVKADEFKHVPSSYNINTHG